MGSKFGLSLLLNVEQYDNAPLSSQNNGIKIHLRNYDDVPQVQDSGFNVAPGYQTLAPLDYLTVKNLAAPWGRCSSMNYEFFSSTDRYTAAKCRLECQTRSAMAACGCKDYYMPGPGEVCSLGDYLYCVGSLSRIDLNDEVPCICPDECLVFSYTTVPSISQISGSVIANGLWNTDSIRENYWHSLEIAHRVDDAKRMQTISGLKSVIDSHSQLTTLIYRTVVNPATSTTNLVSEAVGKLIEIVGSDVDSSQLFLDNYQVSYKNNVAFFIQNISGILRYSSEQIANWQNSARSVYALGLSPEQYKVLKNLIAVIKSTISSTSNSLTNVALTISFCPANLLENSCSSFISDIEDKIEKIETTLDLIAEECASETTTNSEMLSTVGAFPDSKMPTSLAIPSTRFFMEMVGPDSDAVPPCGGFESYDYIIGLLPDVQSTISEVLSCITKYEDGLNTFQSFLDSVDRTLPSVDMSVSTRTMNTLLTDGSWLETLMIEYQKGSRTKRYVSDVFLRESNNRLLLNVDSAVSGLESSVLSLISSIISTIETRTISIYSQLIMYLYKMQAFMPVEDTTTNTFTRQLLMWRSLFPILLNKTLAGFHQTSNQMEQTLGAEVTLAALTKRSATLVPILVRAYTNSLKQTLSSVQSEVRSAQQVIVNSVSALSQQLTTFNDSTVIGDSFVSNNFLQIDIFYGELKYRSMNQTTGYDIVQFLSDFGGCFGLFLGGSILSVFEFLDLLIYNFLVKMSDRKSKKLPTRVNVRPASGVKGLRPKSWSQVHPL